jgi:putative ABC transport system permease protein
MSSMSPDRGGDRNVTNAGALAQFIALIPVAIGNAVRARWASVTMIGCVMLSVLVLSAFLSMARGFRAAGESAGSERMLVMLGRQAPLEIKSDIGPEQPMLLEHAPGLATLDGDATLSPEVVVSVSRRAQVRGKRVNSVLRGMGPEGLALRGPQGFALVEGRLFRPGMYEMIVGRKLARTVSGLGVGEHVVLGGKTWLIVGEYRMANPLFENEYFADVQAVQEAFDRHNQFQSIYGWLAPGASLEAVRDFVAADPRLQVDVLTQQDLYRGQVEETSNVILYLGWPLVLVLSIGTFAGVLNTMLMVIEGRRHNLSVLLMLGFSPAAIRLTVLLETTLLAIVGALVGTALMYVLVDGRAASLVGRSYTTIDYTLKVDWSVLMQGMGLAVAVGLLGGALSSLVISGYRKTNGTSTA